MKPALETSATWNSIEAGPMAAEAKPRSAPELIGKEKIWVIFTVDFHFWNYIE